jgi:hypothetical protein
MRVVFVLLAMYLALYPIPGRATAVGYSLTITTTFSAGDPFPNRIDSAFTEPETGYFQVANTGDTTFNGVIGTIAVSVFAGDLSFTSGSLVLTPGESVSVAIPDESSAVGGFNGPAYFYRPGVEITLTGTMSNGAVSEAIDLLVADRDIQSGVDRTDQYGLTSDSFVLQGGDPWGFQNVDSYALSLADGVYTFSETVPEPGSFALLAAGLCALLLRHGARQRPASMRRAGR